MESFYYVYFLNIWDKRQDGGIQKRMAWAAYVSIFVLPVDSNIYSGIYVLYQIHQGLRYIQHHLHLMIRVLYIKKSVITAHGQTFSALCTSLVYDIKPSLSSNNRMYGYPSPTLWMPYHTWSHLIKEHPLDLDDHPRRQSFVGSGHVC